MKWEQIFMVAMAAVFLTACTHTQTPQQVTLLQQELEQKQAQIEELQKTSAQKDASLSQYKKELMQKEQALAQMNAQKAAAM
jgi:cell division protein FtsB